MKGGPCDEESPAVLIADGEDQRFYLLRQQGRVRAFHNGGHILRIQVEHQLETGRTALPADHLEQDRAHLRPGNEFAGADVRVLQFFFCIKLRMDTAVDGVFHCGDYLRACQEKRIKAVCPQQLAHKALQFGYLERCHVGTSHIHKYNRRIQKSQRELADSLYKGKERMLLYVVMKTTSDMVSLEEFMSYKIVVDSCCELPDQFRKDPRFEIVPLGLEVGDYRIMDDENFDQELFLKKVAECPVCPRSSCPSPERYMQACETEADHVYIVTLSSNLSGSHNSALLGKNLCQEKHGEKQIHVVDSRSASCGETQIAMKAMELEEQGLPLLPDVPYDRRYLSYEDVYPMLGIANVVEDEGGIYQSTMDHAIVRIWDEENGWVNVDGVTVNSGWHTVKLVSDGNNVTYYFDDQPVGKLSSQSVPVYMTSIMPQAFHYGYQHTDGNWFYEGYSCDTYFCEINYKLTE